MSAIPAFEGELYGETETKVMFVGRALNSWSELVGDCSTLKNTVHAVVNQSGALDTLVNADGYGSGPRKYYHKHSKFFRFIKQVLEYLGESDFGTDETWYKDSKKWNQRFVWANLFCIAPRNPEPGTNANPASSLMRLGAGDYVELMKLYIDHYKPDVVVFATDTNWLRMWTKEKSFIDMMTDYREIDGNDTIKAVGQIGSSRVIVCRRPDRRGTSYETVRSMALTALRWIRK